MRSIASVWKQPLDRMPHLTFRVHFVICDIQEYFGAQCAAGKRRRLKRARRSQNIGDNPGAYKGNRSPLRVSLHEPQQIKHPGLVEGNCANDQIESSLLEQLLSLGHRFSATKLVAGEYALHDYARLRRRRCQNRGHGNFRFEVQTPQPLRPSMSPVEL